VINGWVELDTSRPIEEYHPVSEPNLLFELADIRRPQEAVKFIRRYGLLWHGPDTDTLARAIFRVGRNGPTAS
jgi:hypothetical protein